MFVKENTLKLEFEVIDLNEIKGGLVDFEPFHNGCSLMFGACASGGGCGLLFGFCSGGGSETIIVCPP